MLRQSLVPGLVANIKTNQAKTDSLGFFEFGSVFFNSLGGFRKDVEDSSTLPYQEKHLGLVLASDEDNLFACLKGIINNLLQNLINYNVEIEFSSLDEIPGWADKNSVAKINVLNEEIGLIAVLKKDVLSNVNLKKPTVIAELNFSALSNLVLGIATTNFQEVAKYPAVIRDLAFVLNEKILYNEIKNEMIKFNSLINNVELFDIYVGNKLEVDEKSLAFHLSFQSDEKTLTAEEVDIIVKDLVNHLEAKFEARLRN